MVSQFFFYTIPKATHKTLRHRCKIGNLDAALIYNHTLSEKYYHVKYQIEFFLIFLGDIILLFLSVFLLNIPGT